MSNEFKKHKKQFLLDIEISKLPETMEVAENYSIILFEEKKRKAILDEIYKTKEVLANLNKKYNDIETNIWRIKHNQTTGHDEKSLLEKERKQFIMPCPNNDCRGYLSSQYKCQLCNLQTCPRCHEIIGHSKQAEHTCKEENVQTADLIRKDTKSCPSCGVRIFKISGCDQMWCTTCHNAFDWKTGKIVTGVVHNPHFYEYKRKNNGGIVPARNPGDVQCNRLCDWHEFNYRIIQKIIYNDKWITKDTYKQLHDNLLEMHRCISHITNRDLQKVRDKIKLVINNEQIRIDYIVKKISKEEMATKVYRNNIIRQKYTLCLHIYELISSVAIDFFQTLIDCTYTNEKFYTYIIGKLEEFHTLRIYCNDQFAIISNTYNQIVPQIDENFVIDNIKISVKKSKIEKNGKGKAKMTDCITDSDDNDIIDV
jgi:hypothetical protein